MMLENAGIPVPAETALVTLAFFAGQGLLNIYFVIPIAMLGDTAGDNLGFLIGRTGGRPLVEKYGKYVKIDKKKLDAFEALFREKGGRTIMTAHLFSATRITAALAAGISHMPYKKFLLFNSIIAALFISFIATMSFIFSQNLNEVLKFLHLFRLAGLIVAVALEAIYLHRKYKRKSSKF